MPILVRYRDGSIGFHNSTDLNGYATYNEVFPFMNWLVVETDTGLLLGAAFFIPFPIGRGL